MISILHYRNYTGRVCVTHVNDTCVCVTHHRRHGCITRVNVTCVCHTLISKHHRSKFVPTSESHRDAKFKWCFNLARSLTVTVRALIIKGVSPVLIVMTQKSLFSQQSKPESKVHQIDPLVTESAPSSRQIRGSVSCASLRQLSRPFLKIATRKKTSWPHQEKTLHALLWLKIKFRPKKSQILILTI